MACKDFLELEEFSKKKSPIGYAVCVARLKCGNLYDHARTLAICATVSGSQRAVPRQEIHPESCQPRAAHRILPGTGVHLCQITVFFGATRSLRMIGEAIEVAVQAKNDKLLEQISAATAGAWLMVDDHVSGLF